MIGSATKQQGSKVPSTQLGVVLVYAVFVTVAMLVFHWIAEGEFSSVLTLSAIFQCLAFSLLGVHALSTGSVEGISAKCLQLEALALACRLSSTTWLQGYLPDDPTGDHIYQVFDAVSLAMVLCLLHRVLKVQSQDIWASVDGDTLPITPFAVGSLVLAALLHADLNERPIFDALWMCGLFAGVLAVLPQLWMMARSKATVPAMMGHFVAVMAFSRMLSGSYMWHAYPEITCAKYFIEGFNHSGYAVLAAHVVHLVLLADFAYFYVKNLATKGLHSPLEIPDSWMV